METIFQLSPIVIATVPIVVGIVQVAKAIGLPNNWAPIVSLVAGTALVALTGVAFPAAIVQGIIAGLIAAGMWSGVKATMQG